MAGKILIGMKNEKIAAEKLEQKGMVTIIRDRPFWVVYMIWECPI